jgi:hypothetical protein
LCSDSTEREDKKRGRHPGLIDRLWLVKNGVPWRVVFGDTSPEILSNGLPPEDVAAYGIIFGQFEGREYDFDTMSWKPLK